MGAQAWARHGPMGVPSLGPSWAHEGQAWAYHWPMGSQAWACRRPTGAKLGPIMGSIGAPSLGPSWSNVGPSLGPSWAHGVPSLGPSWAHVGPSLGPSWAHGVPSLGLSWAYVVVRLFSFVHIVCHILGPMGPYSGAPWALPLFMNMALYIGPTWAPRALPF